MLTPPKNKNVVYRTNELISGGTAGSVSPLDSIRRLIQRLVWLSAV